MHISRVYRYCILTVLGGLTVLLRSRGSGDLLTNNIQYRGVDAYYHLRAVRYTVDNWPSMLGFDPFTNFPQGNYAGQFGTIYDFLIATIAKFTPLSVELVLFYAPVILAVGVLLLVYYCLAIILSPRAGLLGAGILTLQSGVYYQRTLAGFSDHHAIEVFLFVLTLTLVCKAITSKHTTMWAIVAGVGLGVYQLAWPPGIVVVGIFTVAALLAIRSQSETAVTVLAIAIAVSAILPSLLNDMSVYSVTELSAVHVVFPVGAAISLLGLSTFRRFTSKRTFTYAVASGLLVTGGLLKVMHPPIIDRLAWVFYPLGNTAVAETLTWADSFGIHGLTPIHAVTFLYGASWILAAMGVVYAWVRLERNIATVLLTVFGFFTLMGCTQLRFHYYYSPLLSVFAGLGIEGLLRNVTETRKQRIATASMVVLVVSTLGVASIQAPVDADTETLGRLEPALAYLHDHTNATGLDYDGYYERTDDLAYPDGSYGVLSAWDYGHYITTIAKRPAVANPHQQHARDVSQFFLSQSSSEARTHVRRLSDGNATVRYVLVDATMTDPQGRLQSLVRFHPTYTIDDIYTNNRYTNLYNQSMLHTLSNSFRNQFFYEVYANADVRILRLNMSDN